MPLAHQHEDAALVPAKALGTVVAHALRVGPHEHERALVVLAAVEHLGPALQHKGRARLACGGLLRKSDDVDAAHAQLARPEPRARAQLDERREGSDGRERRRRRHRARPFLEDLLSLTLDTARSLDVHTLGDAPLQNAL
eukprot:43906-Pleurochrysis_carterae.AAC.1